jgi:hypothetical protein
MEGCDNHNILRRAFSDAYAVQSDVLKKDFEDLNKELEQVQAKQEIINKEILDTSYALLFTCKYDVLAGKMQITDKVSYDRSMEERALIDQDGAKTEQQKKDIQLKTDQNRFQFFQYQSCLESKQCGSCDFPCMQMELVDIFCEAGDYVNSLDPHADEPSSDDFLGLNMHYDIVVGPCNKVHLKKIKIKPSVKSKAKDQSLDDPNYHLRFLCAINPDRSENKSLQDKFIDFLKVCFTEYLFLNDEEKAQFLLGIALHCMIDKFYLDDKKLHGQKETQDDASTFSEYAVETIKAVYKVMSDGRNTIADYAAYKQNKESIIIQAVNEFQRCYNEFREGKRV